MNENVISLLVSLTFLTKWSQYNTSNTKNKTKQKYIWG